MTTVTVQASGAAALAIDQAVPPLVAEQFASRLFAQDATLWGEAARSEAAIRLSWVNSATDSTRLVAEIGTLHDQLHAAGIDRVVLCGMGGSSLAPEVICASAGVPITILDSSHPDMVARAVQELPRTVVVVSSKSGSTVETDSQKRVFEAAFQQAGLNPKDHLVIVTDPGSPLDDASRKAGYRVINADPEVGGRYSALTAFGLVPAGLAGADVAGLLAAAAQAGSALSEDDPSNPALRLGAAIAATHPLRDKLYLSDTQATIQGFGDWAEQLIAESTGKQGTGILPVVLSAPGSLPLPDVTHATLVDPDSDGPRGESAVTFSGPLGAQFLLWEAAVAVAGRLLEINPFDQPDVESAKAAARALLDTGLDATKTPDLSEAGVSGFALGPDWLGAASTIAQAVSQLLAQVPADGYLAVMAYQDRLGNSALPDCVTALVERIQRPVTFGWGPRFLHSTGQFHKGGPATGVFLQITDEPIRDLPIPGREFTLGQFIGAQAGGDAQVLAEHQRPVLRLHVAAPDALSVVVDALLQRTESGTAK